MQNKIMYKIQLQKINMEYFLYRMKKGMSNNKMLEKSQTKYKQCYLYFNFGNLILKRTSIEHIIHSCIMMSI